MATVIFVKNCTYEDTEVEPMVVDEETFGTLLWYDDTLARS